MRFSLGILLKGFGMDEYAGWNVDGFGDGSGAWGGDGASYKTWDGDGDGYGDGYEAWEGGGYGCGSGDGYGEGTSQSIGEFK